MSEDMKIPACPAGRPKGWEEKRLGDFVIYQKGKKPKNISKVKTTDCNLPYVNIRAFEKNLIDEYTDGIGCIPCNHNDFLMVWDGARSGYVGKAISGVLGSTLVKIQFPGIFIEYAYLFLQSKYLQINTKAKGTGIPHVDPNLLWNYRFPIPPLAEQHRIVAKIEELFSSLEKGIESLKTAQAQLKTYRQAVLKWAFEGKLTEQWRKNNLCGLGGLGERKKDVLAKGAEDAKQDGELPDGWKWEKLSDICNLTGGVTKGKDLKGKKTIILPYLRVANVQDGFLDLKVIKTIEVLPSDLEKYRLLYGDILYTEGGDKDKLGRGTIWKNEIDDCIHQNHIFRARPISEKYDSRFISYFSQTKTAKDYFFKHGKQTTNLASINLTILSNLPLIIPPTLHEQSLIVAEIEKRLSVCDKLEESIAQSLSQAEALRQSILKKAFEGKLVPQDPNDLPASVLLERIRAERAATVAKNATAGTRRKKR